MDYYDDPKNVADYFMLTQDIDSREVVETFREYLDPGATVLELGMGPGKDFELLNQYFRATGSDRSKIFLERYRQKDQQADLVRLDAITMETDRRFDAIYSNKVLHHLTKAELEQSLRAQLRVLKPDGILFHTFWYGQDEGELPGLRYVYYTEDSFREVLDNRAEIITAQTYAEMDKKDSIYFVIGKHGHPS